MRNDGPLARALQGIERCATSLSKVVAHFERPGGAAREAHKFGRKKAAAAADGSIGRSIDRCAYLIRAVKRFLLAASRTLPCADVYPVPRRVYIPG